MHLDYQSSEVWETVKRHDLNTSLWKKCVSLWEFGQTEREQFAEIKDGSKKERSDANSMCDLLSIPWGINISLW